MSRAYDTRFLCEYDMAFYPFDTQVCTMDITLNVIQIPFCQLKVEDLLYKGPEELVQYFIRSRHMVLVKIDESGAVRVYIVLGRRLLSNILTVYLPTILLNLTGHVTVYFKPFFFEAIITVNLTVMLVLTTMFISVANGLPKTSYVKMIDIWLIFVLIIPFMEVLLQTYIEHLRGKTEENKEINHHGKKIEVESKEKNSHKIINVNSVGDTYSGDEVKVFSVNERVQREALKSYYEKRSKLVSQKKLDRAIYFAHVVNPCIAISFVIIYWGVGLNSYLYPGARFEEDLLNIKGIHQ